LSREHGGAKEKKKELGPDVYKPYGRSGLVDGGGEKKKRKPNQTGQEK